MTATCLAFAGTDMQQAQGIADDDELLFKDLCEVGQMENDPALVRAYVENQLDTYRWLRRQGVPLPAAASRLLECLTAA